MAESDGTVFFSFLLSSDALEQVDTGSAPPPSADDGVLPDVGGGPDC